MYVENAYSATGKNECSSQTQKFKSEGIVMLSSGLPTNATLIKEKDGMGSGEQ